MRAAVARNGTVLEVVVLMKPFRVSKSSGQTKKPLPLILTNGGLLVYTTESSFVGIGDFRLIRVITGSFL